MNGWIDMCAVGNLVEIDWLAWVCGMIDVM